MPDQYDQLLKIAGALAFAYTWISAPTRAVLWGWLIAGIRKALKDETDIEQQKQLVADIKEAVDMIQAIQKDQIATNAKLESFYDKHRELVEDLKRDSTMLDRVEQIVNSLRERVAKLEGRLKE